MHLKTFRVQHYKSLDDVTVEFAPDVTVIVGPNGVGKSNFVDALRFLRDATQEGLDKAILSREGVARIFPVGAGAETTMSLAVEMVQTFEHDPSQLATYQLEIGQVAGADFYVANEYADYFVKNHHYDETTHEWPSPPARIWFKRNRKGEVIRQGSESEQLDDDQSLALDMPQKLFFHSYGADLYVYFQAHKFSNLYPTVLRELKTLDSHPALRDDGSNWASIIRAYKRTDEGKDALNRINECMRTVLPTFEEVEVVQAGSYLVPTFQFKSDKDGTVTGFDPVQLSDGTLRLFGILLAAYQVPRPALLIIEEPEQTIYPAALALLADVFKEVSTTTQVIVTTHSPHLVQQFAPDQIRIAAMNNGVTQIRKIHPHQKESVEEGLLSLEEFMTKGGLQPEDDAPAGQA